MAIIIIQGPAKSGKTMIAVALRNAQVAQAKGALLVDEDQDGDTAALIEKVLVGDPLPSEPTDAKVLPWKPETDIILVGDKAKMLDAFEALVPGFTAFHGPTFTVTTAAGG